MTKKVHHKKATTRRARVKKHPMIKRLMLGASFSAATLFFVGGIIFWGGFNTAMEATNKEAFCVSCHEMRENVYEEYKQTSHYQNGAGVRATCPDCHVPRPWIHKVIRKIRASNELYHKVMGTVDTKEKFDAKRLDLAKRVWETMKETDSRECRNCHDFNTMNPANQKPRARKQHMNAITSGNTCIDCHKGIAHKAVHEELTEEEQERLEAPDPHLASDLPLIWTLFEKEQLAKRAETSAPPVSRITVPVSGGGEIDWTTVPQKEVVLFYPGQVSVEWIQSRKHGGRRAFGKGEDRCLECHDEEQAMLGEMLVKNESDRITEPTPIPGKRGSIPVLVQAAFKQDYLYFRMQWREDEHIPVPFVEGGKMDPENRVKVALMLGADGVKYASQSGCWATCHNDLRSMPDEPSMEKRLSFMEMNPGLLNLKSGVTKYLTESRTEIEIKGKDGKPRGGWDKLKPKEALGDELKAGNFIEMLRYYSGFDTAEDGYILEERKTYATGEGGEGANFTAQLNDGMWVVEIKRRLEPDHPGDLRFDTSQLYNIGFAIHDDYSDARFHHVSFGYKLGFDNGGAEINAVKR